MSFQTYSFADVQATITGPGGIVSMGAGASVAEEGMSYEAIEETDTMHIGADGNVAHSLHMSRAGKVQVRLLKTSPTNFALQQMYNLQRISSVLSAQNVLVITNLVSGDVYTCQGVAFAREPRNQWGKEAGTIEWEFNCSRVDVKLGSLLA